MMKSANVLSLSVLLVVSCFVGQDVQGHSSRATPARVQLGVYRWAAASKNGGAGGNESFARWIGWPVVWALDFMPSNRWDSIHGGNWQLGEWSLWKRAKAGRRLVLSAPLLAGPWDLSGPKAGPDAGEPVSLKAGAKGQYNAHFRQLAENLVKHQLGDTILRLGWEFNGGWYSWRAGKDPDAFAAYWRQIVKTMRSVPGAEKLQFCWNPAQGYQQFPAEKAWPGDEWVDYVATDLYDDSWAAGTYPLPANAPAEEIQARRRRVWDKVLLNGNHGLKFWIAFASTHHKPMAIPEWGVNHRPDGTGGLDNPEFIRNMHDFITDPGNHVAFHCYFDVEASDGHHQLSPGKNGDEKTEFPKSSAEFRRLFGKRR